MVSINEYEVGGFIKTCLLNAGVQLKTAKNGNSFVHAIGRDKTGEIQIMDWNPDVDKFPDIQSANVFYVEGTVDEFNGKKQLKASILRPAEEDEYQIGELLRVEAGYSDDIIDFLQEKIDNIEDRDVYMLADSVFSKYLTNFEKDPAAIAHHHSGLCGMAVHIKQVVEIALAVLESMKPLMDEEVFSRTKDIVTAGAILHDVGKFVEYTKDEYGYFNGTSPQGALYGHLVIGQNIIMEHANTLGIPFEKASEVAHICLSHHERAEWNAASTPATRAAFIVAHADYCSSKVHPSLVMVEEQEDEVSQARNTYNNKSVKLY